MYEFCLTGYSKDHKPTPICYWWGTLEDETEKRELAYMRIYEREREFAYFKFSKEFIASRLDSERSPC